MLYEIDYEMALLTYTPVILACNVQTFTTVPISQSSPLSRTISTSAEFHFLSPSTDFISPILSAANMTGRDQSKHHCVLGHPYTSRCYSQRHEEICLNCKVHMRRASKCPSCGNARERRTRKEIEEKRKEEAKKVAEEAKKREKRKERLSWLRNRNGNGKRAKKSGKSDRRLHVHPQRHEVYIGESEAFPEFAAH